MEDIQDYNNEYEQRLMSIIDRLAPFVQKRIVSNRFSASPKITRLKRKKKSIFNEGKRRNKNSYLREVGNSERKSGMKLIL